MNRPPPAGSLSLEDETGPLVSCSLALALAQTNSRAFLPLAEQLQLQLHGHSEFRKRRRLIMYYLGRGTGMLTSKVTPADVAAWPSHAGPSRLCLLRLGQRTEPPTSC